MIISGELFNPRLSRANLSASLQGGLVNICRAGRIFGFPNSISYIYVTSEVTARR
jgi:hypothetical protein